MATSSKQPKIATFLRSVISTPHIQSLRSRGPARLPVTTYQAFDAAHRKADTRLRNYIEQDRKGSVRLSADALTELDRSQAMYLPANNLNARLKFAQIMARHGDATVAGLPSDQPVFFFTLIVRAYTVREDRAAGFNIKRLKGLYHEILRGGSYVGMVEAALYTNLNAAGASFKRAVSWHVHVIVWGISEAELAAICRVANARYRTIIDGIDAAHYRRLAREEVAGQALYMCKGQLSEYRVWPRKREKHDRETGEVTIEGTGRFSQAKREIRTGDIARMYNIFAGRYLDQLAFAGGAGVPVLHAIRREAKADLRAWERRETAKKASRRAVNRSHGRRSGRDLQKTSTGRHQRPRRQV